MGCGCRPKTFLLTDSRPSGLTKFTQGRRRSQAISVRHLVDSPHRHGRGAKSRAETACVWNRLDRVEPRRIGFSLSLREHWFRLLLQARSASGAVHTAAPASPSTGWTFTFGSGNPRAGGVAWENHGERVDGEGHTENARRVDLLRHSCGRLVQSRSQPSRFCSAPRFWKLRLGSTRRHRGPKVPVPPVPYTYFKSVILRLATTRSPVRSWATYTPLDTG